MTTEKRKFEELPEGAKCAVNAFIMAFSKKISDIASVGVVDVDTARTSHDRISACKDALEYEYNGTFKFLECKELYDTYKVFLKWLNLTDKKLKSVYPELA